MSLLRLALKFRRRIVPFAKLLEAALLATMGGILMAMPEQAVNVPVAAAVTTLSPPLFGAGAALDQPNASTEPRKVDEKTQDKTQEDAPNWSASINEVSVKSVGMAIFTYQILNSIIPVLLKGYKGKKDIDDASFQGQLKAAKEEIEGLKQISGTKDILIAAKDATIAALKEQLASEKEHSEKERELFMERSKDLTKKLFESAPVAPVTPQVGPVLAKDGQMEMGPDSTVTVTVTSPEKA